MDKFQKRVDEVKEHLRGMATMNGNIKNISEEELGQDAIDTVNEILKNDPDWLNEEWEEVDKCLRRTGSIKQKQEEKQKTQEKKLQQ